MSGDTTKFSSDAIDGLADLLPAPNTVDVTIEVLDESFGDHLEADRLPWHALVYDVRNDLIELSVGGRDRRIPVVLRHSIRRPTGVWLEQEDGRPPALLIEAEDSAKTIVRFHQRGDHPNRALNQAAMPSRGALSTNPPTPLFSDVRPYRLSDVRPYRRQAHHTKNDLQVSACRVKREPPVTGIQFTHLPGDVEPMLAEEPFSPHEVDLRRLKRGGPRGPDRGRSSAVKPQNSHEPSRPGCPHGMKTTTSFQNGWDTIKVVGDIRPVDIPSLKSAAQGAFLKRPVRLVIDLAEVPSCDSEGIRWILETRQLIAKCGGELKVVVVPNWPTDRLNEFNLME